MWRPLTRRSETSRARPMGRPTWASRALALDSYAKAIALLEPIVAADPGNTVARSSLARSYLRRSRLLLLLGDSATGDRRVAERSVRVRSARAGCNRTSRRAQAWPMPIRRMPTRWTGRQHAGRAERCRRRVREQGGGDTRGPARERPGRRRSRLQARQGVQHARHHGARATSRVPKRCRSRWNSIARRSRWMRDSSRATAGTNSKYARALLLDRMNVAFILNEMARLSRRRRERPRGAAVAGALANRREQHAGARRQRESRVAAGTRAAGARRSQ